MAARIRAETMASARDAALVQIKQLINNFFTLSMSVGQLEIPSAQRNTSDGSTSKLHVLNAYRYLHHL